MQPTKTCNVPKNRKCNPDIIPFPSSEEERMSLTARLEHIARYVRENQIPKQEYRKADRDPYIHFPRSIFAPYFSEEAPDEVIMHFVEWLLEMDRVRNIENENRDLWHGVPLES